MDISFFVDHHLNGVVAASLHPQIGEVGWDSVDQNGPGNDSADPIGLSDRRAAKLTLKLDEDAIEYAKVYARSRKVRLSRMVETYFRGLAGQDKLSAPGPTGVIAELAGILACKDLDLSNEGRARHLAWKAG